MRSPIAIDLDLCRSVALALSLYLASPLAPTASAQEEHFFIPAGEVAFTQTFPGLETAVLWGDPDVGPVGMLFKFAPGFAAGPHAHTSDYYAVVVRGVSHHWLEGEERSEALGPGSFFFQPGGQRHLDANGSDEEETLLFLFFSDGVDFLTG